MSDFRNHTVRGCEPRGMVRENRQPVGRITNRLKSQNYANSDGVVQGTKVIVRLVTVKTGCRKLRRQFEQFCRDNGITWRVAQSNPVPVAERWRDEDGNIIPDEPQKIGQFQGHQTVVEVTGGRAIDELFRLNCIVPDSVTFTLNVGAPHPHTVAYSKPVYVKPDTKELFAGCPNVFVK